MLPMLRKSLLLLAVGSISLSCMHVASHAAIVVSWPYQKTPSVNGFFTFTLTATSNEGKIIGFNFDSSGGSGLGFQGAMHQVVPFGIPVIMNDGTDAFFSAAGSSALADSHFLVASASGIVVNAAESSTSLNAAFALADTNSASSEMAFAQIVVPAGGGVTYVGDFTVLTPLGVNLLRVSSLIYAPEVPEPAGLSMAGLGLAGIVVARRHRSI